MMRALFKTKVSRTSCASFRVLLLWLVILAQPDLRPMLMAQQKLAFIQITDTHISDDPETHRSLDRILADLKQLPDAPAFVISTGDLTEFGSASEFTAYREIVDHSGWKCYHALGNHDVRWCNVGKKGFTQFVGPLYQSFKQGGIHFIIMDSGVLLEQYGHFSKPQLRWLRQELNNIGTEKPIILAAHHPIFLDRRYVDNEVELLELLEGYNIVLFLCGHGHQNRHWQLNGIHFLMTKAVKSATAGYRLFKADDDSIWIYNRDLNDQPPVLDFACALKRPGNKPKFTIEQPEVKSIFSTSLPIMIRSKEISQIDVSLAEMNWQSLQPDQEAFRGQLGIENLAGGNYFLKLRCSLTESQRWLSQIPIPIERKNGIRISKFETDDAILASPVIDGELLLVGSLDGKLYALDAETMKLNWFFQTAGPIVTAPAVHLDTIFVTSGDGFCYALNRETGIELWRTKAGEAIFSSPIYAEGAILFGASDSSLYALRSRDGKALWQFKTGGYIKARPAWLDDRVFFGSWDGFFYCLATNNGRLIWKTPISTNRYFPAATSNPLVMQDKVIVASHDHVVHAFQISDGSLSWQHQPTERTKPGYSSPASAGNSLYFGSLSGHLFALEARSGEEIWCVGLPDIIHPDPFFDSSPIIADGFVVAGSIGGVVYGVANDSGRLKWSAKLSDHYIFSSPAIGKKQVYIGSCDGGIYKIAMIK